MLRYRHGPRYHYPTTLLDAQRALRLIKARAKEYRVDPAEVGVLGASAGGHLAAMLATLHDTRLLPAAPYVPDDIDVQDARPAFALAAVSGDRPDRRRGDPPRLAHQPHAGQPGAVRARCPRRSTSRAIRRPTFIVHGTNDRLVPVKNALLFYEACLKAGVPAEMHILDNGPHGFGMGANLDDETVREWPMQALRFMARHQWIARTGDKP